MKVGKRAQVFLTCLAYHSFSITSGKSGPGGPVQLQNGWRFAPSSSSWRYHSPVGQSAVMGGEHSDLYPSLSYRSSRRAEEKVKKEEDEDIDAMAKKREVNYWSNYATQYKCGYTCDDGSCLKAEQRCDGYAQCWDGTDEKGCNCKDLIPQEKLCDGYRDCPDGSDEHDCVYGCSNNEFTCDLYNSGSKVKCIPMSKRCDGYADCPLANDEHDCYRMVDFHDEGYQARGYRSHGILQKRIGNYWHTICKTSGAIQHIESYAQKACEHISGYIDGSISIKTVSLSQLRQKMSQQQVKQLKYAQMAELEAEFSVLGACASDYAYQVECPSPQCGGTGNEEQYRMRRRRRRSPGEEEEDEFLLFEDEDFDLEDDEEPENLELIVGGYAAKEMTWPFLVGIFRDGVFYCGGSIVNDRWILTAAHCCHGYDKHTYEVQAGMTRKNSWAPYEQTRHVEDIYVHEEYDSKVFANDIALYKLDRPLYLSKYVTPACFPEGKEDDPKGGDYCKVAGWGDLSESGYGPDHMQEVSLPILPYCQETFTRDSHQICAGYSEGGMDACQGDSGGPLLCYSSASGRSVVSGVVSFGRGCARANEAGAYTRVSSYLSWIEKTISGEKPHSSNYPHPQQCTERCHKPGGECIYPEEKCSGTVECLDAKDELGCTQVLTRAHLAASGSSQYQPLINPYPTYSTQSQPYQKMYPGFGQSRSASGSSSSMSKYPYPYVPQNSPSPPSGIRYRAGHSNPGFVKASQKQLSRTTMTSCTDSEIQCNTVKAGGINECIQAKNFCDGLQHCSDKSDENSCFALTMDFSKPLKPSPIITENEIKGFIIARLHDQQWNFLTTEKWTLEQGHTLCETMKPSTFSTATLDTLETIALTELVARVSPAHHVQDEGTQIVKAGPNARITVVVQSEKEDFDVQHDNGLTKENLHDMLIQENSNEMPIVTVGFMKCSFK